MTNQKQIRAAFWAAHPDLSRHKYRWTGGKEWFYTTDTRCAFVDFLDSLARNGEISEALAARATL
jgi:hypothetical protein